MAILVILIGGGIYYFTKNKAVAPEQNVNVQTEATNQMMPEEMGESMMSADNKSASGEKESGKTGSNMMENNGDMGGGMMTPATKTFTVSGSSFAFDIKTIEVSKGDLVKITFKNSGGNHDFRVDGYNVGTKVLSAGGEETFEFTADKAGSFEYFCSVGSHRSLGMKGTLTVK